MFSVGLVGLPNAGKSTLFNLLTKRSVPAENFPFCTVDPHDGIVEVPDHRIDELAKIVNAQKKVFAAIEFKDIAGLVKGAHAGAGLGNQFLSHIREVDLILMVVRSFENSKIIHVENRVNPYEDEQILMLELTMADSLMLEKMLGRLEKEAKKDKFGMEKIEVVEKIMQALSEIQPASSFVLDEKMYDKEVIKWRKTLNLLTDKPILKLANMNQDGTNVDYQSDFDLDILLESSTADLTDEERAELGLESSSAIDNMIQACYKKLNLATYLTAGEIEARAWTFTKGSTAPQCAGVIHTDFEKKFIKAEVIKYQDFIDYNGRKGASENGKMQMEGKDYIAQDGDVIEFKIGA